MNPVIERIKNRLYSQDKNYLAIFCGGTGSGKSESAISLARLIDPDFCMEKIVFSVEDFFKILNDKGGVKLKKGSAIVWEEMGVSADNRAFFSLQNKAITYIFETFRLKNLAVIMTVPGLGMIDSRVRKLAHQYFETVTINRKEQICRTKVMDMQYNPRLDKIFFKYPRAYINDELVTVHSLDFMKPPDSIINPYKEAKKYFTDQLNLGLELEIEDAKVDKTARPKDVTGIVKSILDEQEKFVYEYGGKKRVDSDLIQGLFNVGMPTAKKAKKLAEHQLKFPE